jgi:hypothetical protein
MGYFKDYDNDTITTINAVFRMGGRRRGYRRAYRRIGCDNDTITTIDGLRFGARRRYGRYNDDYFNGIGGMGYGYGYGYGGASGLNGRCYYKKIRKNLLGRSFRHAVKFLRCNEIPFRVVSVNGNCIPHSEDYRPYRVDLFLATDKRLCNDFERLRYVWTHPKCVQVTGVAFG